MKNLSELIFGKTAGPSRRTFTGGKGQLGTYAELTVNLVLKMGSAFAIDYLANYLDENVVPNDATSEQKKKALRNIIKVGVFLLQYQGYAVGHALYQTMVGFGADFVEWSWPRNETISNAFSTAPAQNNQIFEDPILRGSGMTEEQETLPYNTLFSTPEPQNEQTTRASGIAAEQEPLSDSTPLLFNPEDEMTESTTRRGINQGGSNFFAHTLFNQAANLVGQTVEYYVPGNSIVKKLYGAAAATALQHMFVSDIEAAQEREVVRILPKIC